jgi:5-methyltetrahydropteroyltriglutamate--homocysteine methyltransferase
LVEARKEIFGISSNKNLGPHGNAELAAVEDECIRELVVRQEEVGLSVVTDGELRRRSWTAELFLSMSGISADREASEVTWRTKDGGEKKGSKLRIDAPIERRLGATVDAFKFLAGNSRAVPKVTLPAPSVLHFQAGGRKGILEGHYDDEDQFWSDVVSAYREEMTALIDAGARYIQLDDTILAVLCDPRYRETVKGWGHDADELSLAYVERMNEVIEGRPADVTVTVHECRGNRKGDWVAEGGYDPIAEIMFNQLDVDGFFLEYDSDRAGGFEPLRFLPPGDKIAVLGLISTKNPELEDADEIKRRIERAAKVAPIDQLAVSPQCGFSSSVEGSMVAEEMQWKKLGLTVAVAREVWGT